MPTRTDLRRHPRLRWFTMPLAILCIAGAALVAAFALGFYSWTAFAVSGLIGTLLGVPFGLWATRRIKAEDPAWPPERLKDA